MLEAGEGAEVIVHQYGHYLTLAQLPIAVAVMVLPICNKEVFLTFGCKILAKLIHNTENFYNFVLGNYR